MHSAVCTQRADKVETLIQCLDVESTLNRYVPAGQWFCKRTTKVLTRQSEWADRSGQSLSAYVSALFYTFRCFYTFRFFLHIAFYTFRCFFYTFRFFLHVAFYTFRCSLRVLFLFTRCFLYVPNLFTRFISFYMLFLYVPMLFTCSISFYTLLLTRSDAFYTFRRLFLLRVFEYHILGKMSFRKVCVCICQQNRLFILLLFI